LIDWLDEETEKVKEMERKYDELVKGMI